MKLARFFMRSALIASPARSQVVLTSALSTATTPVGLLFYNLGADVRVEAGHASSINPIERDAVWRELERLIRWNALEPPFVGPPRRHVRPLQPRHLEPRDRAPGA